MYVKVCFSLAFLFLSMLAFGQNGDLKVEIERIIIHDTEITLDEVPGFVIGVIDGDQTYYVDFGMKDKEQKESTFTAHDVFEVGSITKVYTASLISSLVQENILHYDDLINDYLPISLQNPRMDDVTIRDLLQHVSGLPVRPDFFGLKEKYIQNPYAYYSEMDLLEFYRDAIPQGKGTFNYGHTNYALLEVIIERASGKNISALFDEYVFQPCGMKNSFIHFKEEREGIICPGYDLSGQKVSPWEFSSFSASEGAKSSLYDLCEFLKVNMGVKNKSLSQIYQQNLLPQLSTNFNEYIKTGLGWQVIEQNKNYDIITHTGKTNGHHAFIAFVKETKTGVAILSNSPLGTRNLGYLILRMINYNWKRKA